MKNRSIYRSLLRVGLGIIFLNGVAYLPAQENASSPSPEAQMREAASRMLHKADKADCKARDRKILVTNFTYSSGLTSQLGIQLADQFSKELASQQTDIQIIDRALVHSYLEEQRIPGALLKDLKAVQWLGRALGATAVLTAVIEDKGSSLQARVRLFSCIKDKDNFAEELIILPTDLGTALTPREVFALTLPNNSVSSDSAIPRAGVDGVGSPICIYCPQPGYTDPARGAKFSGTILLNVVVSEQGQATQASIVRGVPFGLNEMATHTVMNWRFKSAMRNGKPVTAAVMVEITFHLN